jgi:AraC family transcriptional regulator
MTDPISIASEASQTMVFFPAGSVHRQSAQWRGLYAESVQFPGCERIDYTFQGAHHLLIFVEQGRRSDGETSVGASLKSNLRELSGKLTFVPAGEVFCGWQLPRLPARAICLYIDPDGAPVPEEAGFGEAGLSPRLFFDDRDLKQTALKLKRQVEEPSTPLYAEALQLTLVHELMRLEGRTDSNAWNVKGGLAAWQKKRIANYIDAHVADTLSIAMLASVTGLSPFHFSRMFKQTFGLPPHRYHMMRRVEQAKLLLARPDVTVTDAGLKAGFRQTSAFTAAFKRLTHKTPSDYRKSLE